MKNISVEGRSKFVKIQAKCLGMGSESATWYGSIDARLRGQVYGNPVEDSEIVLLACEDETVKKRMGGHLW